MYTYIKKYGGILLMTGMVLSYIPIRAGGSAEAISASLTSLKEKAFENQTTTLAALGACALAGGALWYWYKNKGIKAQEPKPMATDLLFRELEELNEKAEKAHSKKEETGPQSNGNHINGTVKPLENGKKPHGIAPKGWEDLDLDTPDLCAPVDATKPSNGQSFRTAGVFGLYKPFLFNHNMSPEAAHFKERQKEYNGCLIKHRAVAVQSSDASCGYHALKNGITLGTYLALNPDKKNEQDLSFCLQSFDYIKSLFGTEGPWRMLVQEERERVALRGSIYNRLCSLFRPKTYRFFYFYEQQPGLNKVNLDSGSFTLKKEKIATEYRSALCSYAAQLRDLVMQGQVILINKATIIDFIRNYFTAHQRVDDLKSWTNDNVEDGSADALRGVMTQFMIDSTTIESYLNLDKADYSFSKKEIPAAFRDYNSRATRALPTGGDWVVNEELQSIIDHEKKKGVLALADQITIIEDSADLDRIATADRESYPVLDGQITAVAKNIATQPSYVHIFLLGDMNQLKNSQGHWISVVLYAQKNKPHEYIVMDSLGYDHSHDSGVQKLIDTVESYSK